MFLAELSPGVPFRIRKLQCDNGQEFPFAFALAVQALGIRHRYIRPRRPQQNGKVERSHRIDQEEFWGRHRFRTSMPRPSDCAPGKPRTITNASPCRFGGERRPKS